MGFQTERPTGDVGEPRADVAFFARVDVLPLDEPGRGGLASGPFFDDGGGNSLDFVLRRRAFASSASSAFLRF